MRLSMLTFSPEKPPYQVLERKLEMYREFHSFRIMMSQTHRLDT